MGTQCCWAIIHLDSSEQTEPSYGAAGMGKIEMMHPVLLLQAVIGLSVLCRGVTDLPALGLCTCPPRDECVSVGNLAL